MNEKFARILLRFTVQNEKTAVVEKQLKYKIRDVGVLQMDSESSGKKILRRSFLHALRNVSLSVVVTSLFPKAVLAVSASHLRRARKLQTYTVVLTSGTSWSVPAGLATLDSVECWGGGGGAAGVVSGSSYGGGGGGAYSKKLNVSVTPGGTVTYAIGAGGTSNATTAGTDGGDTWFVNTSTVLAKGGKASIIDNTNYDGGLGGASASGVGDVKFSGGKGGAAPEGRCGSGGGSSASRTAVGAVGGPNTYALGGSGGSASGGGAGGAGGAPGGSPAVGSNGADNQNGGGGGGGGGSKDSGASGQGRVGGSGGFPGGGAGSSGGNNYSQNGPASSSGAGGQIVITYRL